MSGKLTTDLDWNINKRTSKSLAAYKPKKSILMKSYYLSLAFILLLAFTMCDSDDDQNPNKKITGAGPIVTKTLNFPSFNKIENTGVANFNISLGDPQSVLLKAQQNIIDVMTYEVINGTLFVGIVENTSIENAEEISFEITINEINDIKLVGVGDFELSGDFQDELSISLTGVGNVEAYDLEVGACTIVSTGVGDCEVNVRDELDVTITGVGTVYYKGNPSITQSVSGMGSLINDN